MHLAPTRLRLLLMKTCLIIGKVWPEPCSTAAGIRTLDLIGMFQRSGFDVLFASAAQKNEHCEDLASLGILTRRIAPNDSSFDEWLGEIRPDVVMFDRYMIEEQFGWRVGKYCPNALRILDTSDLHCLREARKRSALHDDSFDLFNDIAVREIASIYRSDLTWMISDAEMAVLKDVFGICEPLVEYLPFSVNPDTMSDGKPFAERKHCVMLGSFMHPPNVDSVQWCIDKIWPAVRRQLPDVELHIYGSYSENFQISQKAKTQGVVLKGRMKDAADGLSRYRINLAPLRYGAGLKGKVLDGFRSGTPTIGSSVAFEGFGEDTAQFVAEDPNSYVSLIKRVYGDANLWADIRKQGHRILRERFDLESNYERFRLALDGVASQWYERRKGNFIGQMLRHHNHRSTEFMSRWIELKNAGKA